VLVVVIAETWSASAMAVSWVAFACVFGGALLGLVLRALLPEHHLSPDSKDFVKLGMGLIATMAALVRFRRRSCSC